MTNVSHYLELEALLNKLSDDYERLCEDDLCASVCHAINRLDSILGRMQEDLVKNTSAQREGGDKA